MGGMDCRSLIPGRRAVAERVSQALCDSQRWQLRLPLRIRNRGECAYRDWQVRNGRSPGTVVRGDAETVLVALVEEMGAVQASEIVPHPRVLRQIGRASRRERV